VEELFGVRRGHMQLHGELEQSEIVRMSNLTGQHSNDDKQATNPSETA
jgi:hypothetical protein